MLREGPAWLAGRIPRDRHTPLRVGPPGAPNGMEEPMPENPDNFDQVLEGMKPHLSFSVENKLSEDADAANLKVDLHFKSMDDFEPENVARQVKPLRDLLDLRTKLSDLRGSLQGNEKLEELLMDAVSNSEKLDKLKTEVGPAKETVNE